MAAYQCLNCYQIERSDEQCCDRPDLFCINDMPAKIVELRELLAEAIHDYGARYALGEDFVEKVNKALAP